jgi:hypothetical protein
MKHGTISKIGHTLFDYRGRTKQKYPRGGHCVTTNGYIGKLCWTSPSKDGNVMSYTTTKFEIATPEEIEIFNNAIIRANNEMEEY